MQEYLTHSEAETEQAGADFARALPDGKVVAMYGELGSGKTAFVRGMARGMGLTCRVSSPTFTIVNEYEGLCQPRFRLRRRVERERGGRFLRRRGRSPV